MQKYLNLVAGIDGTWNDASSNTNVFKLLGNVCDGFYYNLKNKDVCCLTKKNYEKGIGNSPTTRYSDGILALRLHEPIGCTYKWLAEKLLDDNGGFEPRLYLFGFSRGAYCAHVLSWILHEVGIPTRIDYAKQIAKAYVEKDEDELKEIIKQAKCVKSPRIQMLGLWDAVTSQCDIRQDYHDGIKSPLVGTIYHAMAANETRIPFPVMQYANPASRDVHQIWFSGVHGEVGGMLGYEERLSSITLNWMACQAYAEGIGFTPPIIPMSEYDFNNINCKETDADDAERTYLNGERIHASLIERMQYDETYRPAVRNLVANLQVAEIERTNLEGFDAEVGYA